ncbi:MAG: hypothetical protein SXV54_20330 [Chloroflexota bacterium]|nr:hypothetical protein [Chloroflexota bacterium]
MYGKRAIAQQVAAIVPTVGDKVTRGRGDKETIRRIVGVRGDGGFVEGGGLGQRQAVAYGVVLVLEGFAAGVGGGGEAVEGVIGVDEYLSIALWLKGLGKQMRPTQKTTGARITLRKWINVVH